MSRWLQSRAHDIPSAEELRVFDADGNLLYRNLATEARFNIADRPFFKRLQADASLNSTYSEVIISRASGREILVRAQAVRGKARAFLGLVDIAINVSALYEHFARIKLGEGGVVALRRIDNGAVVVRFPGRVEVNNKPAPDFPTRLAIINGQANGAIEMVSPVDGVRRITGYRVLGKSLPFFIAVGLSEDDYLAEWRQDTSLSAVAAVLFLAVLAFVFYRLAQAEAGRATQAERLSVSEHRLQEREHDLEAILDNLPSMIGYWDKDLRCRFANHAYANWFGSDPGEMQGKHLREVSGEAYYRINLPYIEAVLRGERQQFERSIPGPDVTYVRKSLAEYIPDIVAGEVMGYYVQATDITTAKETENALRQAQKIGGVGSYVFDLANDCWTSSDVLDDIFGIDASYVRNASGWLQLIHPDDQEEVLTYLQRVVARKGRFDREYRIVRPSDGAVRWCHGMGELVCDDQGQPRRLVGSVQDITERQESRLRLERSLAEQNALITSMKQTTERLELLQKCLARANDVVIITKAEPIDFSGHRIVYVNEAFERLTGYTEAEAIGNTPRMLQGPQTDRASLDRIRAHLSRWQPVREEVQNYTKSGETFWTEIDIVPIADEKGGLTHWISIQRDVTQQKLDRQRLERLLAEQKSLVENDLVGILTIRNRKIVSANPAVGKMFGYDRDEMCGMPLRDFYPGEEAFEHFGAAAYPILAGGGIYRSQFEFVRKDGSHLWADASGSILNLATDESLWCVLDVSERVRQETELKDAKEAAEAANIAKSRFLSTMSHELRTPMNGILGMAQMLLLPEIDTAERIDYARVIFNSGQSLLTLLNDLLDLSKVEAGMIELESMAFAPGQILRETRSLFAETANGKGLRLLASEFSPAGQRYRGDAHRLRQIISNLVSNAIKFTAEGEILIEAREIDRDGETARLEFSVADTGIGVPAEKLHRLFQSFSQVDSSITREFGGSGLGLSIVSQLAALMGGESGVESQPGAGSRFWFRIRAGLIDAGLDTREGQGPASAHADLTRLPASIPAMPKVASARILVVDDNAINRKVIHSLLGKLGVKHIDHVEDGQQAVDAISRGDAFDLILMDLNMPVLGGYEATEHIRAWEVANGRAHTTIVAVTADAYEEDQQRCLAVGMDDFLATPVGLNQLSAILARWLA
jgi:PAS domain S-box-containing protein